MSQGALQVLFTLTQIGDPITKLQVIRIMKSLRSYKDGEKWKMIFEFFKEGGLTPLKHLVQNPPMGEKRLRVRGEAAQEMVSLLQACTDEQKQDIVSKVLPVLVTLIIVKTRDEDGSIPLGAEEVSTPDIRREVLALFNNLMMNPSFTSIVLGYLTTEAVRQEIHFLHMQIKKQEDKKSKKKRDVNPVPTDEELHPLDEEVSKYLKNIVERMALEYKDVWADLDKKWGLIDEGLEASPDDGIDPAMREKLERLKNEGANANEDKEKISKGLEALQEKLMQMEVDKLEATAGTSKKRVFKVVVVGDAGVGKTSMIYRYCKQKKPENMPMTMGCEYSAKLVQLPKEDTTVLLQIFDIQGLERYRKQAPRAFFRDAHGAVVVFDCGKEAAASFYGAQDWKKTVDENFEENGRAGAPCILVANKADLPNENKFAFVRSPAKMERCVRDNKFISWHQTSAHDGKGLKESPAGDMPTALDNLVAEMIRWDDEGKYEKEASDALDLEEPVPEGRVCRC